MKYSGSVPTMGKPPSSVVSPMLMGTTRSSRLSFFRSS